MRRAKWERTKAIPKLQDAAGFLTSSRRRLLRNAADRSFDFLDRIHHSRMLRRLTDRRDYEKSKLRHFFAKAGNNQVRSGATVLGYWVDDQLPSQWSSSSPRTWTEVSAAGVM
jgi:hypothetical protein